jgi:two-component system, OmpR family, sensor kinase
VLARLAVRFRLALIFALVMAIVLAAMSVFVYLRVRTTLTNSIDQSLQAQIGEVNDRLSRGETQVLDPNEPDSVIASVFDRQGHLLAHSRGGAKPLLTSADFGRAQMGTVMRTRGGLVGLQGEWRVLGTHSALGGQPIVVAVATPLAQRDTALHHLLIQLGVSVPFALLLAAIAGYGLTALALRPVEDMRSRAGEISAETPGKRLRIPPAQDEVSSLAITLNKMLDRVETALEHERRLVADASHELRTPLAMLKAELDLALSRKRSIEELEKAVRSAAGETDHLAGLAEDLLFLARSDQGPIALEREHLEVEELLQGVGKRFVGRAEGSNRTIEVVSAPDTQLYADRARLEQALGNLVQNALIHGAGKIGLSAKVDRRCVELHVVDEGSGFSQQFLGTAFERFSRADKSRSQRGTGLGLAIVERIAQAHGGDAHVATCDGVGADVWISIPMDSDNDQVRGGEESHALEGPS